MRRMKNLSFGALRGAIDTLKNHSFPFIIIKTPAM